STAPAERKSEEDRAFSGIPCPIPSWMEATAASPLRLSSEKTESGLRLTLTNAGKAPFAIDPLVLRYPTAEHLTVTVKGVPGGPKSFTYLQVEFGHLGGWERWRVPEASIVVLAPGASHSWDLVLRADHAGVDHISIQWFDRFQVDGEPKAPLLRSLGWSWAK
ncbi:MAG TPA: hypothetical protein VFS92_04095, partial [Planctomycetota bacterium]|nr:hypothetical protein [Planctomycetota bacterium]